MSFKSVPPNEQALFVSFGGDETKSFMDQYGSGVAAVEAAPSKLTPFSDGHFGVVASVLKGSLDDALLEQILRVLKPGGHLAILAPKTATGIARQLMFAGFTDTATNDLSDSQVEISAKKPAYELGSAAPLSLNKGKINASPAPAAASVWTLGGDDLAEADLVDQDQLLEKEEVKVEVFRPEAGAGCGPDAGPVKKACKNCSCGLAEKEKEAASATQAATVKTTSSCGSCGLGDAFRCGTCPYRGLPPFKPGEAVKLNV